MKGKGRVRNMDAKAIRTVNVKIDAYINPKYAPLPGQITFQILPNDLLKVFELRPLGVGPAFIGRWSDQDERLKIDLDPRHLLNPQHRKAEIKAFKRGEKGYSPATHWPVKKSVNEWLYEVSIYTATEKIFDGTVYFNLHRQVNLSAATAPFNAAISTRGTETWLRRLGARLRQLLPGNRGRLIR